MQNYLSDMMAFSMGVSPSLPKYETPQPIHAHINNPIQNTMNIQNSSIGLLNTGSIQSVKNIGANLFSVVNSGKSDVAEEFARLAQGVVEATEIEAPLKEELLQQIEALTSQAALPVESRAMGIIRPMLSALVSTICTMGSLAEIWALSGDVICSHFGVDNPFKKT